MILYFDENGELKEQLTYGNAARSGTTDFKIFAFFSYLDWERFQFASIKFRKPDLRQTEYPALLMSKHNFEYHSEIQHSEYFQDGQRYVGFIFDFDNFNAIEDVPILLDTPGMWQATISLYGTDRTIYVQGMVTFMVEAGVYGADSNQVSNNDLWPIVYASLATKLSNNDAIVVVSNITSENMNKYVDGQIFYDKASGDFFIRDANLPAGYDEYTLIVNRAIERALKFVYVDSTHGYLPTSDLLKLINNKVNRIVYNNIVYYYSLKIGNIQKYFSVAINTDNNTELNEIDVDITTGEYEIVNSTNKYLQDHINNTTIHVTASEKTFWNNKVTAVVEAVQNTTSDNELILTKD